MKFWSLVLLGCSLSAGAMTNDEIVRKASGAPRAEIPVIPPEKAPAMDGVIRPEEWASALKFSSLEAKDKGILPGKDGTV